MADTRLFATLKLLVFCDTISDENSQPLEVAKDLYTIKLDKFGSQDWDPQKPT